MGAQCCSAKSISHKKREKNSGEPQKLQRKEVKKLSQQQNISSTTLCVPAALQNITCASLELQANQEILNIFNQLSEYCGLIGDLKLIPEQQKSKIKKLLAYEKQISKNLNVINKLRKSSSTFGNSSNPYSMRDLESIFMINEGVLQETLISMCNDEVFEEYFPMLSFNFSMLQKDIQTLTEKYKVGKSPNSRCKSISKTLVRESSISQQMTQLNSNNTIKAVHI